MKTVQVVQPREENALRRPQSSLPLKGELQKDGTNFLAGVTVRKY